MIHLWALCLANEFMPLSLGEEDLVIQKMMPLSAYLMLRWSRERNPCSVSLVLVSPSSCAWFCRRADDWLQHCSAQGLLSGLRAFEVSRDLSVQWKTPHLCPFSDQELLTLLQRKSSFIDSTWAQSEWNRLSYLSPKGWIRVKFWLRHGEKKAGLWSRRLFCISGMDKVLTHMATKSPRWLWTLLKTVCLPSPSLPEPLHTRPGQLLSSGSGSQSCCLPPSPSSWVSVKFKCEDGWRANLCHSTRGSPKSWNTIWYWF